MRPAFAGPCPQKAKSGGKSGGKIRPFSDLQNAKSGGLKWAHFSPGATPHRTGNPRVFELHSPLSAEEFRSLRSKRCSAYARRQTATGQTTGRMRTPKHGGRRRRRAKAGRATTRHDGVLLFFLPQQRGQQWRTGYSAENTEAAIPPAAGAAQRPQDGKVPPRPAACPRLCAAVEGRAASASPSRGRRQRCPASYAE